MSGKLHVVFGAGQVGKELAVTLQQQGLHARSVSRTGFRGAPAGIEIVTGDVSNPAFAAAAAKGASVIYMCLNLPYSEWEQHFFPLQMNLINAAERAEAKLVFLENMYMYGATGGAPLCETTPLNPTGCKGRVRAAMTQALFENHQQGKNIATSAPAADFFGPGIVYGPAADLFRNVLSGNPVQMPFSADLPHSLTYLPTVVRALVILGSSDEANGQPWHIPNAPILTPREVISRLEASTGRDASML
jgi:nucleoside-diphosphate-sugar epimerase